MAVAAPKLPFAPAQPTQDLDVTEPIARLVACGALKLDPRLKPERLGTYLSHLKASQEPWDGKLEEALELNDAITLEEALALGVISEDDKRLMEGCATREELEQLEELGFLPEELKLEDAITLQEAVALGIFTEADGRLFEGCADRADLEQIGYPPNEIDEILEEQKGHR